MPDADIAPTTGAPKPRSRIGRGVYWFGLASSGLIAAALTLVAYVQGLPPEINEVAHLDKFIHFCVAGSLAFFLDGVLERRALRVGPFPIPLAGVLLLVPVATEEYLQRYSEHRTSSIRDFLADAIGVAFCIWLSRALDGSRTKA